MHLLTTDMMQQRCLSRSMATEAQPPTPLVPTETTEPQPAIRPGGHQTPVHVMTYNWPDLKPKGMVQYSKRLLAMPIRHDILHRAVIFEGDAARQGTASTKWRKDVHGSHRKLYAQKGSGRARAGDKQSPVRRGGGVAHGPHPRDFSTDLPRKIYDQAWRIALSHRISRGELIVIDNKIKLRESGTPFHIKRFLQAHGWYNEGRSTFISLDSDKEFIDAVEKFPCKARHLNLQDVDVKDLLTTNRLIIERPVLHQLLSKHKSDLSQSDIDISPAKNGEPIKTWSIDLIKTR